MRLLLIGDYRPSQNFGAIATSEALIGLLDDALDAGDELELIDRRLFTRPSAAPPPAPFRPRTPDAAWSRGRPTVSPARRVAYRAKRTVLAWRDRHADALPTDVASLAAATQRMLDGEIYAHELAALRRADVVWLNGEGNLVHNIHGTDGGPYRPAARYLLFMAHVSAVALGKPTAVVNHVVDTGDVAADDMVRAIYPSLTDVVVRDPLSVRYLEGLGVTGATFVPDAAFAFEPPGDVPERLLAGAPLDLTAPYACVADSAAVAYVRWDVEEFYRRLLEGVARRVGGVIFVDGNTAASAPLQELCAELDVPVLSPWNCDHRELTAVLGGARVFLSGRWHASILAALSGTPSILWGSDSHKTRALQEILPLRGEFLETATLPDHLDDLLAQTDQAVAGGDGYRREIRRRSDEHRAATAAYGALVRDARRHR